MNPRTKTFALLSAPWTALVMLSLIALVGWAALEPVVASSPRTGAPAQEEVTESEVEPDVLMDSMVRVNRAVRRLRRQIADDSKKEANLALITTIQEALVVSKRYSPSALEVVPEAERPAFLVGYRKVLIETIRALLDLEMAVLEGDTESAQKHFDRMRELERAGHLKYRDMVEEEEER